jgi:glycosyltransferase involved in cell wall biosynthesis
VKKLKIAMLTTTFFPQVGGAEYQVKWLAEELAKRGHEVYLFTPYEAEEFIEKKENGFPKNIALRKRGANSFSDAFRMFYRFTKSIKRIKPDIVHAHYAFSAGFFAVITKPMHKAPVVITSHGEDIQVVKEIRYGMRLKLYRQLLINLALKLCDAHIIVAETMKREAIEAGSGEDKIYVVHNMYMHPNTEIGEDSIEKVKKKYDIPHNNKILLSVSRLHKKKGLEYLIKSMKNILAHDDNVRLVIVGEGEERGRLEDLVKQLNLEKYVTFTGFVDEKEKHALIKGCDIFCMPSIQEGLPIALFDPMYYSKPIVVTNVSGVFEVLGEGYEYTVEKENSQLLSMAISKLLLNDKERQRIGNNTNMRLRTFLPNSIVIQYEELYKSWDFSERRKGKR